MSYSLSVAADARAALASLELWLQEQTLDEIERVLHEPSLLVPRRGEELVIHDFTRAHAGRTHYVFLTIRPDHPAASLEVLAIGHFAR